MMLKNRTLAQVAAAAGVLMLLTGCQSGAASSDTKPGAGVDSKFLDEAQSRVDAAMAEVSSSIPTEGPALATDKFIVLVPCAQAGEGCAQPAEGAKEAAEAAGWRVQIIDGKGTAEGQSAAINQAVSLGADGIVTFAIDPEGVSGALKSARAAGVKVVASSAVDSDAVDFGGIPTEKLWYDSGQMLADYVITETGAESHTIVLTGNEFSALIPRSDGFKDRLAECDSCEVVKEENFAFAEMPTALPRLVQQLVQGRLRRTRSTWSTTRLCPLSFRGSNRSGARTSQSFPETRPLRHSSACAMSAGRVPVPRSPAVARMG